MPKAFYIRNHSSSELIETTVSELATRPARPAFADKPAFAKWCHDAETSHVFYSLAEPVFPGIRISAQNPIKFLHGIVADYDGAQEAINAAIPTLKFAAGMAPAWVTTTFSNKCRLIWLFERPVPVFTPAIFEKFIGALVKEFKVRTLLPGLDEGALITNPATPYELGTDWRQPWGDSRIPNVVTSRAIHDASDKAKFKADGPVIPLAAVAAEVERRWPGRWTGPFVAGARGVRFWAPGADNLTGCTIRELGVQAWTGECSFIGWGQLLGVDFVSQYRTNKIGGAIEGTYYDGKDYWQRDSIAVWRDLDSEKVKRHLQCLRGLNAESRKGEASELAQAVTTIDTTNRVDGAFPCLFMRDQIVVEGDQRYLNISRVEVTPAAALPLGSASWGAGFPWIASYLDALFDPHQRTVFLSWLSHFYQNAARGTPRRGQALFVAGPASAGKTFLSQRIIGGLMGGFSEATRYVLNQTSFNEQLFPKPVWCVDDAVAIADSKNHQAYSQMVKKIVANPMQEYHPKFKKAVTFRWNGRLVVTLNDDPTSIQMLPTVDGTILDKIICLLASKDMAFSFRDADAISARELPYFASFLSGYVIPDELLTNGDEVNRFGMNAFSHPDLLRTARDSSSSAGTAEVVDMWRTDYFRANKVPHWEGSASDLFIAMATCEYLKPIITRTVPHLRGFSRDLLNIIRQGSPWLHANRTADKRFFRILSPT